MYTIRPLDHCGYEAIRSKKRIYEVLPDCFELRYSSLEEMFCFFYETRMLC